MVKTRARKPKKPMSADEFIGQADMVPNESTKPDPDAKRDHASITLPMNEYEHQVLTKLSKKVDRSMLGTIRNAIKQLAAKEELEL